MLNLHLWDFLKLLWKNFLKMEVVVTNLILFLKTKIYLFLCLVLNSNFSDRFNWFSNQLYELCPCFHSSTIHMVISRERLVLDLVQFFKNQSPSVIRDSKLIVSFKGEEGMDYGGISKEFFYTISRAMTARIFSKDYVLFSSPGENGYYTPDPFSSKIENYEEIFW